MASPLIQSLQCESYPEWLLHVAVFENVENMDELYALVRGSTPALPAGSLSVQPSPADASTAAASVQLALDVALVDLRMVLSQLHLLAALHRALHAITTGTMSTRNNHAELVYSLSPSRNIGQALGSFGIHPQRTGSSCKSVLVCLLAKDQQQPWHLIMAEAIFPKIRGRQILSPLSSIGLSADIPSIAEALKEGDISHITPRRLESLLVTKIATKDLK